MFGFSAAMAAATAGAVDFEFYRLSPYAKSLVEIERQFYLEKLENPDCDALYLFPSDIWKTTKLQDINEYDVLQHLIAIGTVITLCQS